MAVEDMNIVSMERTAAEKKAAEERYATMSPSNGPDYPWGLCLNLGKDELDKLGIKDMQGVELQITSMGAMREDETKETQTAFSKAANTLYGKAEKAEGE